MACKTLENPNVLQAIAVCRHMIKYSDNKQPKGRFGEIILRKVTPA